MAAGITEIRTPNDLSQLAAGSTPTLVDFWAEWCGPCRMVAPVLEELAREMGGAVRIAKVDVDAHPDLAAAHRVSGIPTLVLFAEGREVDRIVGAAPKQALKSWLGARSTASVAAGAKA